VITGEMDVSPSTLRRFSRASHFLLLGLTVVAVNACFVFHSTPLQFKSFVITAAPNANDNAPTTVDAVMVYDKAVLTNLLTLTAKQWFEKREQLANDSPKGFETHEWEVVPGETVDVAKLPSRSGGLGLLVFANYAGPGDHRARLDTWRKPRVMLRDKSFTVVERP
jgi:type VI secretion system protein